MLKNIIKYYHKAKFPLIMTIISFVFMILSIYWGIELIEINYKIKVIITGILPFSIFLLITRFTYIYHEKKNTKTISKIITLILTLLFTFYCPINIFTTILINDMMYPTKDINNYQKFIKSKRLLTVFPNEIPKEVKDPILIYSPGFLQAGNRYVLYYVDPNLSIIDFDNQYLSKAKWIGNNNDDNKPMAVDINFIDLPVEEKDIDNFKIYVIDSYCGDSGWCNHGKYLIVAVNEYTKQVIYESETW